MVAARLPLLLQTKDVIRRNPSKRNRFACAASFLFSLGALLILLVLPPSLLSPSSCSERRTLSRTAGSVWSSTAFPWEPTPSSKRPLQIIPRKGLCAKHVLFLVRTSAGLWPSRRQIMRVWFRPRSMRAMVFINGRSLRADFDIFDDDISEAAAEEQQRFQDRFQFARMLSDAFAARPADARWFVLCEDDTVFSVENLLSILDKYDPNQMLYIGSKSDSHIQNHNNDHAMAYGGAGIALSYALVHTLSSMLDGCVVRYPRIGRPDQLLRSCISELGVPMISEPGFHQLDIRGNALGLLAAHPLTPFVSMHHWDQIKPLHPNRTFSESLHFFMSAMDVEPASFLQQVICYDHAANFSISVSLGYVVQIFPSIIYPKDLQDPVVTFRALNWGDHVGEFSMDSRPFPSSVCERPFLYFWKESHFEEKRNKIVSVYERHGIHEDAIEMSHCNSSRSQKIMQRIRVEHQPYQRQWHLAPRRQCCRCEGLNEGLLTVSVNSCQKGQRIFR